MKRLIVAAASAGALALALIAGPITAGASTAAKATAHRPNTTPTLSVSPSANLKNGETVTLSGSGFKAGDSLIYAQCNADGGGPGATAGSCDLTSAKTVKVGSGGTFTGKLKIVDGPMTAGKQGVACPQSTTQASKAVQCIVGAADLATTPETFAFSPIFFVPPALTFSYAKSVIPGTEAVTIVESGDYVLHGGNNDGGYLVIGAYGSATPPSRLCQGTTNGSTWSTPGLPACTKFFGEVVEIKWNGKKVGLVRCGAADPGSFMFRIRSAKAGKYTVTAVGLLSGETLTGTADVP